MTTRCDAASRKSSRVLIAAMCLIVSACSVTPTPTPTPTPIPEPTPTPSPEEVLAQYLQEVADSWGLVTAIWESNRSGVTVGMGKAGCVGGFQDFTDVMDTLSAIEVPELGAELHEALLWTIKMADREADVLQDFCSGKGDVIWSDIDARNYMLIEALGDYRRLLLAVRPIPQSLIEAVSELGREAAAFSQEIATEHQKTMDELLDLFK